MRIGDTGIYGSSYQKRQTADPGAAKAAPMDLASSGRSLERDQAASGLSSNLWLLQSGVFSTKAAAAEAADKGAVRAEFLELNEKTPAERIREDYLEKHGLTEEELAKMSDEERQKVESEIAELVKRQLGFDEKASAEQAANSGSVQA